jgi:hypothetical protein
MLNIRKYKSFKTVIKKIKCLRCKRNNVSQNLIQACCLFLACWTQFVILKMEPVCFPKRRQACVRIHCVTFKNVILLKLFNI